MAEHLSTFFAADGVQSFGGSVEVGEDLQRVVAVRPGIDGIQRLWYW
ncbi:hypothetical protein ACQV26_03985 [Mycobacterium sp. Lab-001]